MSAFGDDAEITAMGDAFAAIVPKVISQLIGPTSDLIKATTFATVDALIDARSKMIVAGWPEDVANLVVITIINRNADVTKKIGEAMQQAQQNRKSS